MKIFVTGATGFLGQILVDTLSAQGHEVKGVGSKECDLTQSRSLEPFNAEKFDRIYHLAAWVQAGDFNPRHPGEIWVKNQLINTHVLDWWYKYQPQAKMIAMGTSCAYEPGCSLKEENYLQGSPHPSLFPYAMTKRMLYIGLDSLNKQFGLNYLYLVPSTLYGPGYHHDERQLHFIFDLMKKIVKAKYQGERAELWGDGYQKRELVLTKDFVQIMLSLVETEQNQIINIGAGEEHTIRHFADLICQTIDYDPSLIYYDTTKFVGAKSKCLDTEKIKTLLPNFKYTDLKSGINETMQWFLETHQTLAKA